MGIVLPEMIVNNVLYYNALYLDKFLFEFSITFFSA